MKSAKLHPIRETKLQYICRDLTKQARLLGPEARLPTVRELATSLPASLATVNEALRELEARNIIVRRHGVGIYVSPLIRRRNVLVICRSSFFSRVGTSPFWGELVEAISQRAALSQTTLTLHFTQINQDKTLGSVASARTSLTPSLMEEIESGLVDGVIGIGLRQLDADWIVERDEAFVAYAGPGPFSVATAKYEEMIRAGVSLLAKQGRKDIRMWLSVIPDDDQKEPYLQTEIEAFQETLSKYHLNYDPKHVVIVGTRPGDLAVPVQKHGYDLANESFKGSKASHPDGILSLDDILTTGILSGLRPLEIVPGRDVSIVTQSNAGSPVLLGWEDQLTRLEVDPSEIVATLFDVLEGIMKGAPPDNHEMILPIRVCPQKF